jgi:hypothetical protein
MQPEGCDNPLYRGRPRHTMLSRPGHSGRTGDNFLLQRRTDPFFPARRFPEETAAFRRVSMAPRPKKF